VIRDFIVRPVARADFDRWLPLWNGYNAFYGRSGATALPDEIARTTWARFFDEAEPVHAIVVESGDELIGLAHYLFHRSTISIADTCYMQDLYTTEAARRRGVGKALIEAVYTAAAQAGSPRVYWQTRETNATAMRLYDRMAERSGFIVYRRML
jgi:GNAT superfamily N-acetyltransferase